MMFIYPQNLYISIFGIIPVTTIKVKLKGLKIQINYFTTIEMKLCIFNEIIKTQEKLAFCQECIMRNYLIP